MKYLESISTNDILTKISAWKKAKDDVKRLGEEIYDQSKESTKLIVNLLDIIGKKRINIPVETDSKKFSRIDIEEPDENPEIHFGGSDVTIHWLNKDRGHRDSDSLWNFTSTGNADIHEYDGIAVILDYLIKKYPEAVAELKRREDSAKFGI